MGQLSAKRQFNTMRVLSSLFLSSVVAAFFLVAIFGSFSAYPLLHLHKPTSNPTPNPDWNILYHLGGSGPWIRKIDDVVPGGVVVPDGCKIDMIHMLSRHGERYPTTSSGSYMLDLVNRIKLSGIKLGGGLEFLNDWSYFSDAPNVHFNQLTTTGRYAGTLESFAAGVKFRTRYKQLWNDSMQYPQPITFWASSADRVTDTANYFAAGFFGLDFEEKGRAQLMVIPETDDRGGDTLTPGSTCRQYRQDTEHGRENGHRKSKEFGSTYLGNIARRLEITSPGLKLAEDEVFSMQEMCGYEMVVRGSSKWCDVFTKEEWLNFEYARDVLHFYRAGPGNPYARAIGWLWLNATANLIERGPAAGPIFFSFAHDGDIVPMLASLGIFDDPHPLPTTHVWHERRWKTSEVVPMGGKIVLERMVCSSSPRIYIRFNINDGIVELRGCSSGPGGSCPLEQFIGYVAERGRVGGDFRELCGLEQNVADRLSFLKQPGRE